MADSYHSTTFTVPCDEPLDPTFDVSTIHALRSKISARAQTEVHRFCPHLMQLESATTTCLVLHASSRRGLVGRCVETLIEARYSNHSLGFLTSKKWAFRHEPGWGVELITVIEKSDDMEAAIDDLEWLLSWCCAGVGASIAAEIIESSSEQVRKQIHEVTARSHPCFTLGDEGNYIFAYLDTILKMLRFALERVSSVVHINTFRSIDS